MKVSVIIVNYNVRYFLEVCVDSVLRAAQGMDAEIIVVDNNSADDSIVMLKERFPQVIRIENRQNTGFSKANNQGVAIAQGEYVLFLNPDTVMPEDFLRKTCGYLDAHPEAGGLGPRLIDGKGRYAPDGKKSFPTLSVALFKTIGINKIFPRSPYFNKYYAVHVGEFQTAPVEVLSGCCMMVRRSVIDRIGGAFDEDYFMYCEDVDLSYRITQAGYQNIYYPEATLIHYKGESTRKATLSYIRIFNEALATFVRKNYSKGQARLFIFALQIGIFMRAVLGVLKSVFKVLRLPLFDTLIILLTLFFVKDFWVGHIKEAKPVPTNFLLATFPAYVVLWVVSLWLNGAYDQPYRPLRVVRGMIVGAVMILAYYGLLDASLRYSRGLIMLSGVVGTVMLLGLHELLYRLGILRFIPYEDEQRKAVIVGDGAAFAEAEALLAKVPAAPELTGRLAVAPAAGGTALGSLDQARHLLYTAGIGEVIYCMDDLSYARVLAEMQACGDAYDYKIHVRGSRGFVGSNSSHAAGDLYTGGEKFALAQFAQQRNKRVFDIVSALGMILLLPALLFIVKQPAGFVKNLLHVLTGQKTWIGYRQRPVDTVLRLPVVKTPVLPCYNISIGFEPDERLRRELALDYARRYTPGVDAGFLWRNLKWCGKL